MLEITESQKQRWANEWNKIADEQMNYEFGETVQCPVYAYGSELAVLRLFNKFHGVEGSKAEFSTGLNTWFFRSK